MTKGPPHNFSLTELNAALFRMMPAGWHVRQELPIVLVGDSVPEPDLTVVRGSNRDYSTRNPTARDVVIVVEVSHSSLPVDSGEMLEACALNAIPCYWIVSIPERRILVHTKPGGGQYTVIESYGIDDAVPVILDGREALGGSP